MMRYFIREIFYFIIGIYKKIKCKNLKIGFRGKIALGSSFEGFNKIEHHAFFSGNMGYGTYIGEYTNFCGSIGRYCSVGGQVKILSLTHPVKTFVSTSPCFYSIKKQNGLSYVKEQKFKENLCVEGTPYPVIVGNDVYIGYGAIIIAPIVIGDGAVIAAGAVVTKNVEPYTIVGGNPARIIGKRFNDSEIIKLNEIRWWDNDQKWIKERAEYFDDINQFINSVK